MKNEQGKISIVLLFLQAVSTVVLLYCYLSGNNDFRELFLLGFWGPLSMLFVVWVFYSWKILTSRILSYYAVFILVAVLFHFGQAWVQSLSPDAKSYVNLTDFYSDGKINTGFFFSFCCLMILHFGGLVAAFFSRNGKKWHDAESENMIPDLGRRVKEPLNQDLLMTFGIVLFCFSFFMKLIIDARMFGYVLQGGYLAIFDNELSGVFWRLAYRISGFFYPAVYIILYTVRNNDRAWNFLFSGVILYNLMYGFFIGNRGSVFMFILALILYRHTIHKRYTKKESLKLALFGFLVLMLSSVIALTRVAAKGDMSINGILSGIAGYNLIYGSISEFGGTLMTLLVAMRIVPETLPFAGGISYLASSVIIIPDVFGLFANLTPYITVSGVLNEYHYGLGGSFIAEAYYNFGNYSALFMLILGFTIGKYTLKLDLDDFDRKRSTSSVWASLMYLAMLMYIRDQFYSITSGMLQYWLYPLLLLWMFRTFIPFVFKRSNPSEMLSKSD